MTQAPSCELCASKNNSIFCVLGHDEKLELSGEKHTVKFKKKEVIFREGSRPSGLFCIFKGKVKISKIGDEGREQIVRLAKDGDLIGYRTLISGGLYAATATALEDCTICFISQSVMFDYLKKNPELSFSLMQIFSNDLRSAESRLTELTQKPMGERAAEAILILKKTFGTNPQGFIDVALTREEFSNMLGTTTETAIRYLSDFRKRELIEMDGRWIKILEPQELEDLANIEE